ncbi:MAG TPA: hypothetical protein VK988_04835 [Acidimicrobiales bacterium]|nr:hypothetical protein [Acidimicrobiales bacterium]
MGIRNAAIRTTQTDHSEGWPEPGPELDEVCHPRPTIDLLEEVLVAEEGKGAADLTATVCTHHRPSGGVGKGHCQDAEAGR